MGNQEQRSQNLEILRGVFTDAELAEIIHALQARITEYRAHVADAKSPNPYQDKNRATLQVLQAVYEKIPARRSQRRYTTGRNQQINIKATAETIERLYRLADEQRVPLGELLERALNALEKDTK